MTDDAPAGWIPVGGEPRRITDESEILEIAMGLASDRGDMAPSLIQHVRASRRDANRVMCGAGVPGQRESYLIAIRGNFTSRGSTRYHGEHQTRRYSVITLVVDVATGAPTDSGSSNEYPDLSSLGKVVTDYEQSTQRLTSLRVRMPARCRTENRL